MDHVRLLPRTREEQEEMSYFVNKGPDGRFVAFRPIVSPAYRNPCESAAAWTAATGTIAASTDYFQCGLASLKIARNDNWTLGSISDVGPLDTTDGTYNLRVRFYVPGVAGSPLADNIQFSLGEGGVVNYLGVADAEVPVGWNVFDSPIPRVADFPGFGSWLKSAGYVGNAVDTFHYACRTIGATGAMYLDEVIIYRSSAAKAKVVFTLDDFGVTSTTTMAYILERHGWRGTFGAICSTMTPTMWELARDLERRGHLVCCHGLVDSPRFSDITASQMRSDIISAQKLMRANGCTRGSRILILPGGQWGTTVDHRDVFQQYTDCVIGVSDIASYESDSWNHTNRLDAWNPNPPYDKRLWSRGFLGDAAVTEANINTLITAKGFEPIMLHSLGGSYLSQADFESRCAYIASKVASNDLDVSTVELEVYG